MTRKCGNLVREMLGLPSAECFETSQWNGLVEQRKQAPDSYATLNSTSVKRTLTKKSIDHFRTT
jgi:hypothetical protein